MEMFDPPSSVAIAINEGVARLRRAFFAGLGIGQVDRPITHPHPHLRPLPRALMCPRPRRRAGLSAFGFGGEADMYAIGAMRRGLPG